MSPPTNPFEEAARKAAEKTDEQLGAQQPKGITWEEVQKMLPDPADQERLNELMQIVQAATAHNEKVASLIQNINKLGGVVVKVLSKMP